MSESAPLRFDAEKTFAAFEGLWCSGQLSVADIARLPALGVATVINLALPTSSKALSGEAEQVTALGMNYVHIPVLWDAPKPVQFEQFAGVMATLGQQPVWLHCAKNMRASAFVYLYRLLIRGETEEQASWPMSQIWAPNPVWQQWISAVRASHRHSYGRGAAH
ncbi:MULTISPECIES: protein tyrosine phosphatase family protein [unclassified Thiomonas]|uniref:protein tyrosine phosphatase family protein n=1 Tax=unclassified Thiomonas TaxID=2625466 RepID=UPI0004DBC0A4|nr:MULTISPECIES: protein tyrosine phosphatase family protein [unclassified Thiomonas]MDD5001954.1 protein tyrosine phosphatase family protein [Thiomonas arsenitoxydans]CDW94161.1 conserved hypothetical protein [Thiomonas sp. CB2]VDY04500.1 conserved protein of unknown function [Thiomonas sp. Bio17B3]VDY08329.1 conserved protein of unknown function [Thiomonas sp. Sup16B3]VDY12751.1 putative (Phosphotyrosine protein) phosphatase II [Thiomonas sp. OC7]